MQNRLHGNLERRLAVCSDNNREEQIMRQNDSRQSAEIIPFPRCARAPVYGTNRSVEAEAAKHGSVVDTTGWYHVDAIEEEIDGTCRNARRT